MPGFYINNVSLKIKLDNFDDNRCEQGRIEYNNFYIARNTLSKFLNDKLFFETDEFIIVLEGIIFNKNQMMENFENWEDSFIAMVCENPNEFFIKFRGMFSGAVYNKTSKEWNIFTDHLGAKAIFYYLKKDVMIIGSQLNYITDTMKAMKIERSIDLNGFKTYMM
ncbi:MAG: hypothetical protein RSD40_05585, partial [Bacilli bacterium]